MDYHAVISSEIKQTPNQLLLPVYEHSGRYYVLAEQVVLRKREPLLVKINIGGDWADTCAKYEYHHNTGSQAYYEVEIININSGKHCIYAPELHASALSLHTSPAPQLVGFMPVANMVQACEKAGKPQIFNFSKERFSWRAIYAVPAAGVAFVAIDVPVFVISFTGYLISETL